RIATAMSSALESGMHRLLLDLTCHNNSFCVGPVSGCAVGMHCKAFIYVWDQKYSLPDRSVGGFSVSDLSRWHILDDRIDDERGPHSCYLRECPAWHPPKRCRLLPSQCFTPLRWARFITCGRRRVAIAMPQQNFLRKPGVIRVA